MISSPLRTQLTRKVIVILEIFACHLSSLRSCYWEFPPEAKMSLLAWNGNILTALDRFSSVSCKFYLRWWLLWWCLWQQRPLFFIDESLLKLLPSMLSSLLQRQKCWYYFCLFCWSMEEASFISYSLLVEVAILFIESMPFCIPPWLRRAVLRLRAPRVALLLLVKTLPWLLAAALYW